MARLLLQVLLLLISLFYSEALQCKPCVNDEEVGNGGNLAFNCDDKAAEAADLVDGTKDCLDFQLLMFQRNCCSDPPVDYCPLCDNYVEDKVIPKQPHSIYGTVATFDTTCKNVAEWQQFLQRDGVNTAYGECDDTRRGRSRVWCGCDGVEPTCTLTCSDGNPPPDPSKADPLYGETCERWMYEVSGFNEDECKDIDKALAFSVSSFCCGDVDPPKCSICPEGMKVNDSTEAVWRTATCADIEEYAQYMPVGFCGPWYQRLVDLPWDEEAVALCCVKDENAKTGNDGDGVGDGSSAASERIWGLLVVGLILLFGLL